MGLIFIFAWIVGYSIGILLALFIIWVQDYIKTLIWKHKIKNNNQYQPNDYPSISAKIECAEITTARIQACEISTKSLSLTNKQKEDGV